MHLKSSDLKKQKVETVFEKEVYGNMNEIEKSRTQPASWYHFIFIGIALIGAVWYANSKLDTP
jgi:hypothetical protein